MSEYPNTCFSYIGKTKFYGGTFVLLVTESFPIGGYFPVSSHGKFYRYYIAFAVKLPVKKHT